MPRSNRKPCCNTSKGLREKLEMRKQRAAIKAVFDREVWVKAAALPPQDETTG